MTKEEYADFLKNFRPKNFKYKFIFTNDEFQEEILKLSSPEDDTIRNDLDTINNPELIMKALESEFISYGNNVKKAKEPTLIDDGIFISKMMVSKTGKALLDVQSSHFSYDGNNYMAIKFVYEKFYILEIFITI